MLKKKQGFLPFWFWSSDDVSYICLPESINKSEKEYVSAVDIE